MRSVSSQVEKKDGMEAFSSATSGSQALFDRAQRVLPSGTTRSPYYYSPYPLYIKKGEGCYVWDVDGNRYLDFANNMGPLVLGHRHPSVQKAVLEQASSFWCGGPTENEVKLAETILRAFPMGDQVLFTPSGTEASMKLIRAARAATRKDRIMISTGAFHGSHDIVTSSPGIPSSYKQLVTRYRYNDEESFMAAFKKVRNELAAVLVEGVLGAAGSVPPTKSFLKTVREETEKAGVALILDEVVTGFRVARGGISERLRVRPDGVILGKIIGGGFPVGAFVGSRDLMKKYEYTRADFPRIGTATLPQAGTFNAHAVTMAAGLATLDVLTPLAYEHLEGLGDEARAIMAKLGDEHRVPHSITGIGSLFMFHFSRVQVKDYETAARADESRCRLFDALMLAKGVLLPAFHTAICSLPMGKTDLAQFERAADESLEEMKGTV